MMVTTNLGLVDYARLEIKDEIVLCENARTLVSEWYLDGLLVRRDAMVNGLRALNMGVEQSSG